MTLDGVQAVARELLSLVTRDGRVDLWLWEHTQRVHASALAIADWSEVQPLRVNSAALKVAAWFHDAGWALQFRDGRLEPWQVLAKPTSDLQRELAAGLIEDHAGPLITPDITRRAAAAVRDLGNRTSDAPEAVVLAEARTLEDFGVAGFFRLARTYLGEGRSLLQLVDLWQRQQEYDYWNLRLSELRYERTRRVARERLPVIREFINRMKVEFEQQDLRNTGV